jgi:CDP-4-dehydro-6-deoxyglucose reductase
MLSPTVRALVLDAGPGFVFEAGQWVALRVPLGGGRRVERAYSIASAPRRDGRFEIAVGRGAPGGASAALHALQPGDALPVSVPQGAFTLGTVARLVLMVATGPGIAPLRAMLQATAGDPSLPPVTVLHGARNEDERLFREDFEALARNWRGFRYLSVLSEPGAGWCGKRGLVQAHVLAAARALGDCDALLSGHAAMIEDVRKLLVQEAGVLPGRVKSERFD